MTRTTGEEYPENNKMNITTVYNSHLPNIHSLSERLRWECSYTTWNKKQCDPNQTMEEASLRMGVIRSGRQPRVRRRKKTALSALFTNKATHKFEWHHNFFSAHHNFRTPRPRQREICIATPIFMPPSRFAPRKRNLFSSVIRVRGPFILL